MPREKIRLRPLAAELGIAHLETLAGYHDLDHSVAVVGHSGNECVGRHEAYHDQLITYTPFGNVQFAFARVHRSAKDAAIRRNAGAWSEELLAVSTKAHESFATYAAIKSFAVEHHASLLATHERQYQSFFRCMADVIDPVFSSSYLQFLVGKTIIEACMSSRLRERLCEWSLNMPTRVNETEAPDIRLEQLMSVIGIPLPQLAGRIEDTVAEARTGLGLPGGFDPQSEASWLSLTPDTATQLEQYLLGQVIRKWLYPIAAELWPCPLPADWLSCGQRFCQHITRLTGVDVRFDVSSSEVDAGTGVSSLGRAVIDNSENARRVRLHRLDDTTDPMAVLTSHRGRHMFVTHSVLDTEPDYDAPDWNHFVIADDAPIVASTLSHVLLQRILQIRRVLAGTGLPIPSIELILVGMHSSATTGVEKLCKEMVDYHTIGDSDGGYSFDTDRLIWYMGGDFFVWYEYLISQGELECTFLYKEGSLPGPGAVGLPAQPAVRDLEGVSMGRTAVFEVLEPGDRWFVFRSGACAGVFLRIMSAHPSLEVGRVIAVDFDKGRLRPIPPDERATIGERLLQARIPITLSWSEF